MGEEEEEVEEEAQSEEVRKNQEETRLRLDDRLHWWSSYEDLSMSSCSRARNVQLDLKTPRQKVCLHTKLTGGGDKRARIREHYSCRGLELAPFCPWDTRSHLEL
ncbi:hypothetical protein ElyMa_002973900 [Elysia marginata]|uniref:Uncharacterized protein n=1 Tax=Elysia marginata TaxID=1093978 RepID=A0AAV4I8P7_9GAST|nr:hypothetical protein ElyMa_002973900 [Elysia marginata]